jgi:hypothetical protein
MIPQHLKTRGAQIVLTSLVLCKERIRSRLVTLPVHREPEAEGVLLLCDELINTIVDNADMTDARAAALIDVVDAFLRSINQMNGRIKDPVRTDD